MRGCGFASLEQCEAEMSGITGTCDRDPGPRVALAHQPKHTRPRRVSK
jgi:hypothetical protein